MRTLSTPMGMGNDMYFFRLYEKSTKKVHEGLASPLDSRGRRQIFKIWRRYWKFRSMAETQENTVYSYALATAG